MKDSTEVSDRVHRMQPSDVKDTIDFKGKKYLSSVIRLPDESLPKIKNEEGAIYADNRVFLRLSCGGKMIVDKVFTKKEFASVVDSRFINHALLEGVVFDRITPQGFTYAASVGYPDTDLYQPIRILIMPDGKMTISKEEIMDEGVLEAEGKSEGVKE